LDVTKLWHASNLFKPDWVCDGVQGSGGMVLVDPAFQRAVVAEARARGIPIIFDEARRS
jgi:4-aminobutyrate aminotransferase-like enzyme